MESNGDAVRVKEEPYDTWPDTGDDCTFGSVNSSDSKNFEKILFPELSAKLMNEVMPLQDELDEKVFIDFECKDVKPQLPSFSTSICKTEYRNIQSNVKIENQTNNMNENIVISNIESHIKMHTTTVHNSSKSFECGICPKSCGQNSNLKRHINTVHNQSKPFQYEICHKSFGQNGNLKRHIMMVHNRSKSFECEICHRSFAEKGTLKTHINLVCEFCTIL